MRAFHAGRYGVALKAWKHAGADPAVTAARAEAHFRRGVVQDEPADLERALALDASERNALWYAYLLLGHGRLSEVERVVQARVAPGRRERILALLADARPAGRHQPAAPPAPKWAMALRVAAAAVGVPTAGADMPSPPRTAPAEAKAAWGLLRLAAQLGAAQAWSPAFALSPPPPDPPDPCLDDLWRWTVRRYAALAAAGAAADVAAQWAQRLPALFAPDEWAALHVRAGAAAWERGDWSKAAAHWREAGSLGLDQPLALAYERLHEHDAALRQWERVLSTAQRESRATPEAVADLQFHVAGLLAHNGRRRAALAAYDRAFALGEPEDPDAYVDYADLLGPNQAEREAWALARYHAQRPADARVGRRFMAALGRVGRLGEAVAVAVALRDGGAVAQADSASMLNDLGRAHLLEGEPLGPVVDAFSAGRDGALAALLQRLEALALWQRGEGMRALERLSSIDPPGAGAVAGRAARLFEGWAWSLLDRPAWSDLAFRQAVDAGASSADVLVALMHCHMQRSEHGTCRPSDPDLERLDNWAEDAGVPDPALMPYLLDDRRWRCPALLDVRMHAMLHIAEAVAQEFGEEDEDPDD